MVGQTNRSRYVPAWHSGGFLPLYFHGPQIYPAGTAGRGGKMTTSVSSLEGGAASNAQAVPEGELLRHPASTRFIHWMVAMFFILALLSGLAIYTPWLYHWLTPIFGGGPTTRL